MSRILSTVLSRIFGPREPQEDPLIKQARIEKLLNEKCSTINEVLKNHDFNNLKAKVYFYDCSLHNKEHHIRRIALYGDFPLSQLNEYYKVLEEIKKLTGLNIRTANREESSGESVYVHQDSYGVNYDTIIFNCYNDTIKGSEVIRSY